MRMMLQVVMPIETANAAIRSGQFSSFVQKVLADLKPEAAYFTETNGARSGYIFFDMKDCLAAPRHCRTLVPRPQRHRQRQACHDAAGSRRCSRRCH